MNNNIYTIGFTKKTAEKFFTLLNQEKVNVVLDIRLNNSSQLAGFSKYPDIEFFLRKLCNIDYIHDTLLSPTKETLKLYKNKKIDWDQYTIDFNNTMVDRNIEAHIKKKYSSYKGICLLCSEDIPKRCHRSIVAKKFVEIFGNIVIDLC